MVYKAVPDFIDLHYNNFHWFTFNVADIFITIGIIFFIIKEFFFKKLNDEKIFIFFIFFFFNFLVQDLKMLEKF